MDPARWRRIEEIYHAAAERKLEEQAAFLALACAGDEDLRREVESLLTQPAADGMLDRPAWEPEAARQVVGQRISHYEIQEKLGEGGMGAVYRAYDTQLRRPMALKVLPPEYASDPQRRERLLREARAACALNHPNIVGIYEVGSDNGVDFIAMEFIEGKSLGAIIPAKGLPLGKALDYAVQIAGGLAKAHAAGVIHRDLKPANIMLTGPASGHPGLVKLLDFGLARRVELEEGHETTLTMKGAILGTPAYMSPEPQRLEIAGLQAYSPSASPTASRLVFQRQRWDPDIWRYHMNGGMEPFIVSSLRDSAPQFSPDGTRIAFESNRSGDAEEIWVTQADGSKPVQMTDGLGRHQGTPRWSPDGRWIAFDSQGQDGHWGIYAMDAAGSAPRRITFRPSNEAMPFWSRDGKWLYFRSDRTGRQEIWRVPFAGGVQEQVTKSGGYTAFESADGQTLFYTRELSGPLFARLLSGGAERQVLPYIYMKSFVPLAEGIYYIGRWSGEYYPLEFFQFSSNSSRLLAKIGSHAYEGLSVSPDRKTILFSTSVSNDAHLMMIENFQ